MNVYTGAIGLVKVRGITIAKMANIEVRENIRRIPIRGIGQPIPTELAPVEWAGTLTCQFMVIDFKSSDLSQIPGAIQRNVQTIQEFDDTLFLNDEGVQVDMFRRLKDVVNEEGIIQSKLEPFAIVKGLFIDADNFSLSEGQVGTRNQSFQYIHPIIFPQ